MTLPLAVAPERSLHVLPAVEQPESVPQGVTSQLNGTPSVQVPTVVIMSNRVMSDAQFASAVNAGGASRRLDTGAEGPEKGYYVGTPGHEKVLTAPATAGGVAGHRASIQGSGVKDGYQGGWQKDGAGVLDRSVRVNSRALAQSLGEDWKQDAVYDANRGADIHMGTPLPTARVKA